MSNTLHQRSCQWKSAEISLKFTLNMKIVRYCNHFAHSNPIPLCCFKSTRRHHYHWPCATSQHVIHSGKFTIHYHLLMFLFPHRTVMVLSHESFWENTVSLLVWIQPPSRPRCLLMVCWQWRPHESSRTAQNAPFPSL